MTSTMGTQVHNDLASFVNSLQADMNSGVIVDNLRDKELYVLKLNYICCMLGLVACVLILIMNVAKYCLYNSNPYLKEKKIMFTNICLLNALVALCI